MIKNTYNSLAELNFIGAGGRFGDCQNGAEIRDL